MEPEKKDVQEEQVQVEPTVDKYLEGIPGSPSKEQVELWKQQHGEVFCSGFSETEVFIWRPVSRVEFITLQTKMDQEATQYDFEDKVVETCVLWTSTSGESSLTIKAGSLSTLYEQVMQKSNFMNPAMASTLVVKL